MRWPGEADVPAAWPHVLPLCLFIHLLSVADNEGNPIKNNKRQLFDFMTFFSREKIIQLIY